MSGPEETPKAGPEQTHGAQAPQGAVPPGDPAAPDGADDGNLPARLGEERLAEPLVRTGMFGVQGTPDTSGYGLLRVHRAPSWPARGPTAPTSTRSPTRWAPRWRRRGSAFPTRSSAWSPTGAS